MTIMKRKKAMGTVSHFPDQHFSVCGNEDHITESSKERISLAYSATAIEDEVQQLKFNDYNYDRNHDCKKRWDNSAVFSRFSETEKYEFRWKTVMGKSRSVYSNSTAVTPHLFPRQHNLLPLIFIVFILLADVCQGCKVEQCWRHYTHGMDTQGISQGPNPAYCQLLKTHSECIRATARSCRGDLKYHSTSSLVMQWTHDNNCSYVILNSASLPPVVTKTPRPVEPSVCTYHGRPDYQHCALFGDPHLRTFQNETQTCKVLGAWPLIDNAYLAVQVTNEAVVPESNATATTKVTVIIKGGGNQCAQEKTYEAQVDNVPSAFIDGTQSTGHGDDRYVKVKEKSSQTHVEIVIRYIATTIVVRQTGRYLTVAIRMPKDVVRQGVSPGAEGMQLCLNGCPAKERIPYRKMLAMPSHKMKSTTSREVAVAKCKEFNLTDFYFDSCVFDLMTTGDINFGEAASRAQHDLWRLNPKLAVEMKNRTVLPVSGTVDVTNGGGYTSSGSDLTNSGPGRPQPLFSLHLLCVAIVIIALREFLKSN